MSLVNNSYNATSCLKQLQQLVNQVTESDKSSHSQNKSNDISVASTNNKVTTRQNSKSQLSNFSNDDDEVTVIYPLPTKSTEFNAQITLNSSSSIQQLQSIIENLIPSPTKTIVQPTSTNTQNRTTNLTYKTNQTPIWQSVAHMENLLSQSDQNPSVNPTWPYCKPTSENEKRKKRVICKCPNCSVNGGNKTYSITGRLQHNCHIPGCGKIFDWPSILQAHLRSHIDSKPFSCSWYSCDKKFKRKEELVRHIRIHTGLTDFVCPHCNLGFVRSDHLNKHVHKVHESSEEKRPAKKRKLN